MSHGAEKPLLIDCGWYISFMNYYATGEGVTSCIAVAGVADHAEEVLKQRIDEYFHRGIKTSLLNAEMPEDVYSMYQWLPNSVKETLDKCPVVAGYFYSELHYNLA